MANSFWENDAVPVAHAQPSGNSGGFWEDDAKPVNPEPEKPFVQSQLEALAKFPEYAGGSIPIASPIAQDIGATIGGVMAGPSRTRVPYANAKQTLIAESDARRSQFEQEHPNWAIGGNVLGAVAMPMGPEFKAAEGAGALANAGMGMANIGSRVGTMSSIAATDAALRGTDATKAAEDAAMWGAGAELGLGALKKAAPTIEGLKNFRNERVIKTATGQNKRAWKEIASSKDLETFANDLRTPTTETGGQPVVPFGASTEEVLPRAKAAAESAWQKVEGVYQGIDELTGGKSVDPAVVMNNILDRAANMPGTGTTRAAQASMMREAEFFQNLANQRGKISLEELQGMKNTYLYKMSDPRTHALGADGNNAIRSAITDAMEHAMGPKDAEIWKEGMRQYGSFATAAKAADDRALANISNRFFSPSDYGVGLATGIADAVRGGMEQANPIMSGVKGVAGALLNKAGRQYGGSAAGVTAEKLAEVLQTSADKLGPYAAPLKQALDRGPQALAITHYMLSQQDGDYRKLMGGEEDK